MTIQLDLPLLPLICCNGSSGMAEQRLLNGSAESFSCSELIVPKPAPLTPILVFSVQKCLQASCFAALSWEALFSPKESIYSTLPACLPIYFYIAMRCQCYPELQVPKAIKFWHWYHWMIDAITDTLCSETHLLGHWNGTSRQAVPVTKQKTTSKISHCRAFAASLQGRKQSKFFHIF